MMEGTIVCFGDSNTWGFDPAARGGPVRYPRAVRWPGVLAASLGRQFRVVEEGLNGRTTVLHDPLRPYRCGRDYLEPCLESHAPLDLVVIFLGTNDLADRFAMPAVDVAKGLVTLGEIARCSQTGPGDSAPHVLLVVPPRLGRLTEYAAEFSQAPAKAEQLGTHLKKLAGASDLPVLDLAPTVTFSELDGIHLDRSGHTAVGSAVSEAVRAIGD